MDASNPSQSRYLSLGADEIRVARVRDPKDDSNLVNVQLETVKLDASPIYDALSYCWVDARITRPICLNGQVVWVTVNLEAALRQLSSSQAPPKGELWLWVDAICINQNDFDERAQQVGMMFRIYQFASRVHIWLGVGEPEAMAGMRLLRELVERMKTLPIDRERSDIDFWSTEEQRSAGIEALASLCRVPYLSLIHI